MMATKGQRSSLHPSRRSRTRFGVFFSAGICGLLLAGGDQAIANSDNPRVPAAVNTGKTDGAKNGVRFYVNASDPKASDNNDGSAPTFDTTTGSGPWRTLAKAAAAMRPGDTTRIKSGLYPETNIRFTTSGIKGRPIRMLADAPGGQVILDGHDQPDAVGIRLAGAIRYVTIAGLTIRNMSLAGLAAEESPDDSARHIELRELHLNRNGDGVNLAGPDGFSLYSLHAAGNRQDGIRIHGSLRHRCRGVVIAQCESFDNGRNGLSLIRCTQVRISGGTFYCNGADGLHLGAEGRSTDSAAEVTVTDCMVHDNLRHGIALVTGCGQNTIAGCRVYKNRDIGILLAGCGASRVRGNRVFGNTREGVVLSGSSEVVVRENESHHQGVNGFAVVDGSHDNQLIQNQSYFNGMRGFLVSSEASENRFLENEVHDNMILGFGVYERATRNVFAGNRIYQNVYHGFALLHDAHANTFTGNVVHHNSGCGFYSESSRENLFEKNDVHHNDLDGFALLYESVNNKFRGNQSHDNRIHGYLSDLTSVSQQWSRDNRASGNGTEGFAKRAMESIEGLRAYTK